MSPERENRSTVVYYVANQMIAAFAGKAEGGVAKVERFTIRREPEGFENGLVTDLDRAIRSIEALNETLFPAAAAKEEEISACVVLANSKLRTYTFSSSQYYQGQQRAVTVQEVRSVVDQTRSVATLPLSEFVLQAIPESFLVNDLEGVQNPLGLEAYRLGVQLKIHTMNFQDFKNISRVFEAADVRVQGYYPKTLTLSEAVLSDQEKEEGVLLVDIAEDALQMVLWKDGNLTASKSVPAGAGALSRQMAQEWQIDLHDAFKVKEAYGSWMPAEEFTEELIPLVERNGKGHHSIKRRDFQEKFRGFSKAWLGEVLEQARAFGREHHMQHPHYVFTGSAAAADGFLDFLHQSFEQPARTGVTKKVEAPQEILMDPALAGALGMFRWLSNQEPDQKKYAVSQGFVQRTLSTAREWFFATF